MLAGILHAAGYKTGLYTSPHLKDFRERIRVNGEMIDKGFIQDFVERIRPMIDKLDPSFFEITVVMALDYFVQQQTEIVVMEVGLGGRFDSTNVIIPELSVITNIGWDHMNMLGDTLQKIAFEKAGIIKKNIPVVIGESSHHTKDVFISRANEENAPISFADLQYYATDFKHEHHKLVVSIASKRSDERKTYQLDLSGYYQTKNLVTVLGAIDVLKSFGWKIPESAIEKALPEIKKLTGLHGRWDIVHEHPTIVLDVAHNEDGIRKLVSQIELTDHLHLHIVIGMVKDKEIDKALSLLPKEARYYFTKAQIPRAMPEKTLAEKANMIGLEGQDYPEVNTAIKAALSHAQKQDLILVCGSVFVVGEVEI
jgi:dihydrofolate synthase/folylpolyglutamate synthase